MADIIKDFELQTNNISLKFEADRDNKGLILVTYCYYNDTGGETHLNLDNIKELIQYLNQYAK